jgi:hypothetical protein
MHDHVLVGSILFTNSNDYRLILWDMWCEHTMESKSLTIVTMG